MGLDLRIENINSMIVTGRCEWLRQLTFTDTVRSHEGIQCMVLDPHTCEHSAKILLDVSGRHSRCPALTKHPGRDYDEKTSRYNYFLMMTCYLNFANEKNEAHTKDRFVKLPRVSLWS